MKVLLVKGELLAGQVTNAVTGAKRCSWAWGLSKASLHEPHPSTHPCLACPQTRSQRIPNEGAAEWGTMPRVPEGHSPGAHSGHSPSATSSWL